MKNNLHVKTFDESNEAKKNKIKELEKTNKHKDDLLNFKKPIGSAVNSALGYGTAAQAFNIGSAAKAGFKAGGIYAKTGKWVTPKIRGFNAARVAGYAAAREVGAHALNKVAPKAPYEAKYGVAGALAAPILVPNAPLKGKLAASAVMGVLGALTSYINKKIKEGDIKRNKTEIQNLEKKSKLSEKIAKDIYPKMIDTLKDLRKSKQISATDSEIVNCAKQESRKYAKKASLYIINKATKTAQDTINAILAKGKSLDKK